jgi:outer membrane lipoprotein-sorting protein
VGISRAARIFHSKAIRAACLTLALAALTGVAYHPASAQSADLDKVLAQMDAASAKFQSAQADFEWDQYEKIVDDHDLQGGTIYFERKDATTQMAAHITKPDDKVVVYKGGELQFYQPKIDQITIFSAGVNRSQYESFLTLGFGGSGKDLAANWNITYQGSETIAGTQTAKLDLVPKQASVKSMFEHVTIWVDPARAISLRQQFFEPSGDVRTATYSNIKYNEKVPATAFTIKTTSKTQIVRK